MRKKLIFLFLSLFLLHTQNLLYGQEKTAIADTINQQLKSLISSSNSFKAYKVIKTSKIQTLRRDIHGRVADLEKGMNLLQTKLGQQEKQLDDYQGKLTAQKADLKTAIRKKKELSLFGITTTKSTYNTLMVLLLFLLIIGLLFFFFKYQKSRQITLEARQQLEENEQAFSIYKKKALETQQKLGRQIVDERRKITQNTVAS